MNNRLLSINIFKNKQKVYAIFIPVLILYMVFMYLSVKDFLIIFNDNEIERVRQETWEKRWKEAQDANNSMTKESDQLTSH